MMSFRARVRRRSCPCARAPPSPLRTKLHKHHDNNSHCDQSAMDPPVRLYNVDLSEQELDALLEKIRSSPYIDEVESGEEPRESSPLYNEVEPTKDLPPGDDTSIDALLKHAGNPKVLAVAKKANKDQSVLIVEVKPDGSREELLVAPRDVIEVCCNCRISNMDLTEFKALAKKTDSDVYDSQR